MLGWRWSLLIAPTGYATCVEIQIFDMLQCCKKYTNKQKTKVESVRQGKGKDALAPRKFYRGASTNWRRTIACNNLTSV